MVDIMGEPGQSGKLCRILSLDGGGAKGFYTLGVLREIEGLARRPLCEVFDLIFGTSTGSIIAALLSLGYSVEDIHQLYRKHVPEIMRAVFPWEKSAALTCLADQIFENRRFDTVRTGIGIVATKWQLETPMIFKNSAGQVHGRKSTFVPGFGCTISDAVQASCSAYPFFNRKTVVTSAGDHVELMDGGYCANNPTLYAIADATAALGYPRHNLRVVSVGVGRYPEPRRPLPISIMKKFWSVRLLQKTLEINTASMEQLREVLFGDVQAIRISESFEQPEMATDLFEHNAKKLNLIRQRGAESFAKHESVLQHLISGG